MTAPTEFTMLPRCLRQFSNKVFSVSVDCQLNQYTLRAQSLEGRMLALIWWNWVTRQLFLVLCHLYSHEQNHGLTSGPLPFLASCAGLQ